MTRSAFDAQIPSHSSVSVPLFCGFDQVTRLVHVSAGTVLAIALRTEPGQQGSYGLESAKAVTRKLREHGIYARPLGNIVYVMCTPTTSRKQCASLLGIVTSVIADRD